MNNTIKSLSRVSRTLSILAGFAAALPFVHAQQPAAPAAGQVRIAAASDLRFALDEVIAAYGAANPQAGMTVIYGASGTFYAQIAQGAPFDLFLSADSAYPRDLVQKGLADGATLFTYAIGHLVLWSPAASPLDVSRGLAVLRDSRVRKVAIANPLHAPYGRAAEAALKQAGLWTAVESKLVLGENITQAAQFVATGAADVGLIARSLAFAPEMRSRGKFWDVPPSMHPRLEQSGVVLARAADPAAAARFRAYFRGEAGRRILARHGFDLP